MPVLALVSMAGPAAAQEFPIESDWVALPCDGHPMDDPFQDESGAASERDLVGDESDPVGYRTVDQEFAFFRIRLDDDPMPGGNSRPFAWGILLDRDTDLTNYEAQVLVNGIAGQVELYSNATTTLADDPTDPPDEPPVATWPIGAKARSVPATTTWGGDADWFLEVAVPWVELEKVDVGPLTPMVVWLATSSTATALNGDFACHDGSTGDDPNLSDVGGDDVVLDPGGDSDGDGVPDTTELDEGSDPADPDSVPEGTPILEGGGGCSTGGGGALGWLLALALVRRRQPR
jgi:hypothetical protein